jgi:hypothetical protein
MMDIKKEAGSKLQYEKPMLRTIELAAEEVLVTKCKQSPSVKIRSQQGCAAVSCNTIGGS